MFWSTCDWKSEMVKNSTVFIWKQLPEHINLLLLVNHSAGQSLSENGRGKERKAGRMTCQAEHTAKRDRWFCKGRTRHSASNLNFFQYECVYKPDCKYPSYGFVDCFVSRSRAHCCCLFSSPASWKNSDWVPQREMLLPPWRVHIKTNRASNWAPVLSDVSKEF